MIAALERLQLFKQRRIYVELPVRVGERQGGPMIERPSAAAFRETCAKARDRRHCRQRGQRQVDAVVRTGALGDRGRSEGASRRAPNVAGISSKTLPIAEIGDAQSASSREKRNCPTIWSAGCWQSSACW